MRFTPIIALASSAALVAAAPAPIKVGVDDVILFSRDGRFQMMKRDELDEIRRLRESDETPPKPGYLDDDLITVSGGNETALPQHSLDKRDTRIVVPNPHSRFLGWDVQVSQVVKGKSYVLFERLQ